MSPQSKIITVPPMELSLDQFLAVIRQLDEPTRAEVARVLVESKMDAELRGLIEQLAQASPADDISDAEIQAGVRAVRQEGR